MYRVLNPQQSTVYRTIKVIWVLGPVRLLACESSVTPVLGEGHLLSDYPGPNDAVWLRGVYLLASKG
jgi:hypothetical protein